MKKRILSMFLATALILALCAGCGDGQSAVTEAPTAPSPTEAPPTEVLATEAPTEAPPTEEPISEEITVGTEEELLAALEGNASVIHLSGDIELSESDNILIIDRSVTLDLNGHTFPPTLGNGTRVSTTVSVEALGCNVTICNGAAVEYPDRFDIISNGILTVDNLTLDLLQVYGGEATVLNSSIDELMVNCGCAIEHIENTIVTRYILMESIALIENAGDEELIKYYKESGLYTDPYIVMPDGTRFTLNEENADQISDFVPNDTFYQKNAPIDGLSERQ